MNRPRKRARQRRQPTQDRAHETVEAILDAVIRLLKRGRGSDLTTNRIAEAAGVSIGSVYQYFPDKRAIFAALHERHIQQVDRVLQQRICESAGEPLEHLVTQLLDGTIELHAADPELAALLDAEVPHRAGPAREFPVRWHEPLKDALRAHVRSLGGDAKLDLRAFLLANMIEALGHAVGARRPRALSQRSARTAVCAAILAALHA